MSKEKMRATGSMNTRKKTSTTREALCKARTEMEAQLRLIADMAGWVVPCVTKINLSAAKGSSIEMVWQPKGGGR